MECQYNKRKRTIAFAILALALFLVGAVCLIEMKAPVEKWIEVPDATPPYASWFNDVQDIQMRAAKKYGLQRPPKTRTNVPTNNLAKIGSNDAFVLRSLTQSVPYLRPNAAKELESMGLRFQDELASRGLPRYRFEVTSVLRTEEDVRSLRASGNKNASANSCHSYGTTFDISYIHYTKSEQSNNYVTADGLTKILAKVLREEQEAGRIYVKYERAQSCFHITVRM